MSESALTQPQRFIQAAQGLDATAFVSTPDYVSLYTQLPERWGYDMDPSTGISRAAYLGEVFIGGTSALNQAATKADIAAATTGVSSFNTRTGAVVLTTADVTGAGGAPSASPSLSGVPLTPTAAPGTSTTQIASTAFVTAAIGAVTGAMVTTFNGRSGAITLTTGDITGAGGAPSVSPAFTGNPTGPTMASGNASSALATTQFVSNAIAGAVVSFNGRTGAISLSLSDVLTVGGAPINSPSFTGTPLAPTAPANTSTTQIASTAFVMNAITSSTGGVASFNGRSGIVTLTTADVTNAGGAPILSPIFTGTPEAPTPTGGDNSTKIATTAFVDNALASLAGVTTFNGRAGAVTLQLADVTSVGGAPLASPAFTGSPTTTTAPPGDNSTRVADTAFVAAAIAAQPANVASFNGRTGAVTLTTADVTGAGGAPAASPTFTGTMTLPATVAGSPTWTSPQALIGVTNGSAAPAGQIGEYIVSAAGGGSMGNGVVANVAQIVSLGPGDWDMWARAVFTPAGGAAPTAIQLAVSLTSGTFPSGGDSGGLVLLQIAMPANAIQSICSGVCRISIATTTAVFAVAQINFTGGTATCAGTLMARRVR